MSRLVESRRNQMLAVKALLYELLVGAVLGQVSFFKENVAFLHYTQFLRIVQALGALTSQGITESIITSVFVPGVVQYFQLIKCSSYCLVPIHCKSYSVIVLHCCRTYATCVPLLCTRTRLVIFNSIPYIINEVTFQDYFLFFIYNNNIEISTLEFLYIYIFQVYFSFQSSSSF